ncbi:hypothetical protein FJZ26_04665, partial [Candidatus Parvarchaeota archaeon]|nr:hypothetical protein [Candidatus Parvarchaeota archaeon]
MEYLARIKFRGFKSFKRAEATFSPGYVALAGPNGSGKSNVTDGIRFALGEMALKSLRAKKVPELINTGCKQAEVVLYFEGERKLEVRRAIRPDGKIAYQLNGKGTTRTGLLEALRLHRIEAGTHNIIAQGQVQQIIEMSSKEKREIIDSVAGISEYEAKKKEALGELEKVEGRIGEAKIVLAEREGFLVELEREKDSALAYKSAQESLRAARGTLVCRELEKLENEFESVHARMIEGKKLLESKQAQLSGVSGELSELEAKRSALFEKINQLSKKDSSMQAIATLKASIESAGTAIKEKLEAAQKLVSGMRGIDASIEEMQQEMGKIEEKAAGLKLEADRVQKEIDRFDSKSKEGRLGAQIENLKSEIGMMAAQIEQKKEEAVRLDAEISKIEELARFRSEEKQRLSVRGGSQEVDALKFTNELETLKKDIASLTAEIDKLFAKEKQTNKEVPEIEKELLLVREKVTVARVSAQASGTSPALVAVKEMRQSGAVRGIYGTVGELIKFEEEHATAIEAAANVRLNYIVVDSIEVAGKAIDYLKQRKAGRCTFIPLDKISPGGLEQANSMRKAEGVMGPLLDFVRFEAKYYGAMAYVFGDTVLVESFAAAKKIGPGKIRMVCTTGELFEKSGTVSGGFTRPVAFARSTLEKL